MGQFVVMLTFRREINSISKTKMPEIDPETVENFQCNSRKFSDRFRYKFKHNQQQKSELCINFWKITLQRFASKTLRNDSKRVEIFQHIQ